MPRTKATFLFVTREGTTGILQLIGLGIEHHRPEDFGQVLRPYLADPTGKVTPLKAMRSFLLGVQIRYNFRVEGEQERATARLGVTVGQSSGRHSLPALANLLSFNESRR